MYNFQNAIGMLTYEQYMEKFKYWAENSLSSKKDASSEIIEFTRLNWARTMRLQKSIDVDSLLVEKVKKLQHKYSWLVITEAWCGDSAQNLPYIAAIAKMVPETVDLYILLRDQNLEVMDAFLTNGARAIPKLVIVDEMLKREVYQWGPRPAQAQHIVLQWKKNPGTISWSDMERQLHTWYTKNKGRDLQIEFNEILNKLIKEEVVFQQ